MTAEIQIDYEDIESTFIERDKKYEEKIKMQKDQQVHEINEVKKSAIQRMEI